MHIEPNNLNNLAPSLAPERLDIVALCKYIGGTRPVHPSTVYRMVKSGKLPVPMKLGPKSNRWHRSQVDAALAMLGDSCAKAA